MSNMRSKSADGSLDTGPFIKFSLEQCLEYVQDDELLEVTPLNLRMRKRILNNDLRMKAEKNTARATPLPGDKPRIFLSQPLVRLAAVFREVERFVYKPHTIFGGYVIPDRSFRSHGPACAWTPAWAQPDPLNL